MKKYIAIISIALAVLTVGLGYAGDTVTVNFIAKVTASTCKIEAAGGTQTVDFGTMSVNDLTQFSSASKDTEVSSAMMNYTAPTPVDVKLLCASSTPKLSLVMNAPETKTADSGNILQLQNSSGGDSGFGVELYYAADSDNLNFGATTTITKFPNAKSTTSGMNEYDLAFTPQLYFTDNIKNAIQTVANGGDLSASVTMTMQYS